MTGKLFSIVLASLVGASLSNGRAWQRPEAAGKPTHVIDLVGNRPQPSTAASVPESQRLRVPFGRLGRAADDSPLPAVLDIRLLDLDRTSYLIGDEFVYELLVSNKSGRAVPFPTSADEASFRKDMPRATAASVFLTFDDPSLGPQVLGSRTLYGAPAVAGSIVILAPGETVRLRLPGTWFLQSPSPAPPPRPWQRELHVKASVQLFASSEAHPLIQSDNAVDIVLQQR
jgi:hypothetical protein